MASRWILSPLPAALVLDDQGASSQRNEGGTHTDPGHSGIDALYIYTYIYIYIYTYYSAQSFEKGCKIQGIYYAIIRNLKP